MNLDTSWVDFDVDGQQARGWFAKPAMVKEPLPGVLVIQEAWGVDEHIRDVTERFAQLGYAAFAPELFSFGGTPEALKPERTDAVKKFLDTLPPAAIHDPAAREAAMAHLSADARAKLEETRAILLGPERPWDQYVTTLKAARRWLAANASQGKKVGSVGYCMGGALSLRLACADPELAATVVYYGYAPPLEQLPGLRAPVLGLYGENDPRILAGLPGLQEAMRNNGKSFEVHVYADTPHAFSNDTRKSFRVGPTRDAWARTLAFFAGHLDEVREVAPAA